MRSSTARVLTRGCPPAGASTRAGPERWLVRQAARASARMAAQSRAPSAQVQAERQKAAREAAEVNALSADCRARLEHALPALAAAERALGALRAADFAELGVRAPLAACGRWRESSNALPFSAWRGSDCGHLALSRVPQRAFFLMRASDASGHALRGQALTTPPRAVGLALAAALAALGRPTGWEEARRALAEGGFAQSLLRFDKDAISDALLKTLAGFAGDPALAAEVPTSG